MARPRRTLSEETRELLDQAWEAHLEAEHARWRRDELALSAAMQGATWREVGAAVGMSPQAAHERYRHQLQPRSVTASVQRREPAGSQQAEASYNVIQ